MEVDFHSMVTQGPFWSHTSYCILTRGKGSGVLCVSDIKVLNSLKRLNTYNSITSQRPHQWIPQPWESGFHHMKFLGDTEFETIADTSMNWLHPAVAVFTHTPLHPHFLHHLATIPYILSLWVSQVQVSQVSTPSHIQPIQCFTLPLLRPRGPTRKHQCVHFCKVPPLSLSGSSFLGLCWNRVDGNEMGKF